MVIDDSVNGSFNLCVCSSSGYVLFLGLRIYSAGRLYLVPSLHISSTFIHTSMLALVQSFLSSIEICKQPESSINLMCLGTTGFISSWPSINIQLLMFLHI